MPICNGEAAGGVRCRGGGYPADCEEHEKRPGVGSGCANTHGPVRCARCCRHLHGRQHECRRANSTTRKAQARGRPRGPLIHSSTVVFCDVCGSLRCSSRLLLLFFPLLLFTRPSPLRARPSLRLPLRTPWLLFPLCFLPHLTSAPAPFFPEPFPCSLSLFCTFSCYRHEVTLTQTKNKTPKECTHAEREGEGVGKQQKRLLLARARVCVYMSSLPRYTCAGSICCLHVAPSSLLVWCCLSLFPLPLSPVFSFMLASVVVFPFSSRPRNSLSLRPSVCPINRPSPSPKRSVRTRCIQDAHTYTERDR